MPVRRDSCAKEAINIIMGINRAGECRVIDYNITPQESAENYAEMLASFKERGMKNVKLVISDDLSGIDTAIDRTFPQAERQRCWIHVQRTLQNKVRRYEAAQLTHEFKEIRLQPTYELAAQKLNEFCTKWGKRYPSILRYAGMAPKLLTFMHFPIEFRSMIYTNNRLESMNKLLKMHSKKHEQFTSVDSLEKFLVPIFND